MLVVLAPIAVLALVSGLAGIWLGLKRPNMLVLVAIPVILLPDLPGTFSPKILFIALIGFIWLTGVFSGRWRLRVPHLLLVGFAVLLALSYLVNGASNSWKHVSSLLAGALLCMALISFGPSLASAVRAVALTGFAMATLSLLLNFGSEGRLEGLKLNPNFLGHALAISGIALLAVALGSRNPLWLLPIAATAFALLSTGSRGATIALAVGAIYLIAGCGHRVLAAAFAVVAIGTAFLLPPVQSTIEGSALLNRSVGSLESNNRVRLQAAGVAVRYSLENPLYGIGYGQFTEIAASQSALRIRLNTHNDYLRLAAEAGLTTLLLFVSVVAMGLRFNTPTWDLRSATAVLIVGLVGLLFANSLANLQVTGALWICLGSLIRVRYEPEHAARAKATSRS